LKTNEKLIAHIYSGSRLGPGRRPSGAGIATWELYYT